MAKKHNWLKPTVYSKKMKQRGEDIIDSPVYLQAMEKAHKKINRSSKKLDEAIDDVMEVIESNLLTSKEKENFSGSKFYDLVYENIYNGLT